MTARPDTSAASAARFLAAREIRAAQQEISKERKRLLDEAAARLKERFRGR